MSLHRLAWSLVLLAGAASVGSPEPGGAASESAADDPSTASFEPSITLKWSARNERAVYGYLIYRAERRQGPFVRINDDIVRVGEPASGDTANSYRWVDTTVEPGATYYYYLDTVSHQARKERFSGVIKKTAPDSSQGGAVP